MIRSTINRVGSPLSRFCPLLSVSWWGDLPGAGRRPRLHLSLYIESDIIMLQHHLRHWFFNKNSDRCLFYTSVFAQVPKYHCNDTMWWHHFQYRPEMIPPLCWWCSLGFFLTPSRSPAPPPHSSCQEGPAILTTKKISDEKDNSSKSRETRMLTWWQLGIL